MRPTPWKKDVPVGDAALVRIHASTVKSSCTRRGVVAYVALPSNWIALTAHGPRPPVPPPPPDPPPPRPPVPVAPPAPPFPPVPPAPPRPAIPPAPPLPPTG